MDNLKIPLSFLLQWHITERCNWRCQHCYQEWDKMPPDLTLKQLDHIFKQFLSLLGKWQACPPRVVTLNITGGEPLFRKDFFQFFEQIGQYSHLFRLGILSNGSFLTKGNILKLKKANLSRYQVSLEGMENNNDKIRGKGTFKKTIEAIKLLVGEGIPTRVSLTLTKENMKDIPALANLCDELGVLALGTRRLIPWGGGKELKEQMLQPEELRNFYLSVKKMNAEFAARKRAFRVVLGCESAIFTEDILADHSTAMRPNFCGVAEGRGLTIMANGDIMPCRRLPIVVGNALKQKLSDVYYSSQIKEFQDLDKLHHFCHECSNFINCFGGAKCLNYTYAGKWNIPDVQCWRAYKKLGKPKFT